MPADLGLHDQEWGLPAAQTLHKLTDQGLGACPISIVEIAPQFDGKEENVRRFLSVAGIQSGVPWLEADTRSAAEAWSRHEKIRKN